MNQELTERLWRHVEYHQTMALEALEKSWPDAYEYHKQLAEQYIELVDTLIGGESDEA